MAEMQDVTEALLRALPSSGQADIESIRHATIGLDHLPAILEDPKSLVKTIGVPVQEHSQWDVSLVRRHGPVEALRRVIVIIIHFSNCSGVIVVAY